MRVNKKEKIIIKNVIDTKPILNIYCIDCSGSMAGSRIKAVKDALNAEKEKFAVEGNIISKMLLFEQRKFTWVEGLNTFELYTGGMTPLYDAIIKAIKEAEKHLDSFTVVIKVFTDGLENYSITVLDILKEEVEEAIKKGILIASNCYEGDFSEVSKLGIENIITHDNTYEKIVRTMSIGTEATIMYAKRVSEGDTETKGFYTKTKQ